MFNIPEGAVNLGFQSDPPEQVYVGRAVYRVRLKIYLISGSACLLINGGRDGHILEESAGTLVSSRLGDKLRFPLTMIMKGRRRQHRA